MAAARFYSSTSGAIDLTTSIAPADTSITVSTTSGLPGTTPFTLILDPGLATEEIVEVTNVAGLTLTVSRGVDGSAGQTHSAGVGNVRHMATARDFREPQEHIGSSANIHGVGSGSSVVGTDTTQTLKNKTAQAAAAGTIGLVVKGTAAQTADYLTVEDSAGADKLRVKPGEGTVEVAGTSLLNDTGSANFYKYVVRFLSVAADVVTGVFRAAAAQTADILQIQNSAGTVLAKFDKDGKLTTPQVTSTGSITGTTGTFSGAITSPTLTTLTDADTALDGRLDTIEANLGAQTTFAATSAAKDNKKIHWGSYASGALDGSGYAVITHAAGFTPTVVVITSQSVALQFLADTFTATTFRVRVINSDGSVSSTAQTFSAFLGE